MLRVEDYFPTPLLTVHESGYRIVASTGVEGAETVPMFLAEQGPPPLEPTLKGAGILVYPYGESGSKGK